VEGGVSTAAGARSVLLGLLAVNHASRSSDWLGGRSSDAGLRPPPHVLVVTVDTDGC